MNLDGALVAARFAHFAATMGVFGVCLFAAGFAPASLRPEFRRLPLPLALVALASAALWLVFVARSMAGGEVDVSGLGEVLGDTSFGGVWRIRLALLLGLVVAAARGSGWLSIALISALATASLGWVGHAAREDGALGLAHRANHALHLLAAGAWIGGLAPFLVCLRLYCAAPERRDALTAMRRFSFAGHFAVAATLASGAIETALTLRALPWPADSPYRAALDVKIGVVAATAALALVNRYVFAPRIARSSAAARGLAAGAAAEVALGAAALALVSAFATLDPR